MLNESELIALMKVTQEHLAKHFIALQERKFIRDALEKIEQSLVELQAKRMRNAIYSIADDSMQRKAA